MNESVTTGNWLWWLIVIGDGIVAGVHERSKRSRRKRRRARESGIGPRQRDGGCQIGRRRSDRHIHVSQRSRILLIAGRHFENHVELIGLRIDRRYLPLAEGIVERVVDVLRGDAQPARRIAIDIDHQSEAVVLLIARDVAQFGNLLHLVHQARSPQIQQRLVGRIERVLILRPADAVFHRQILHRLHVKLDARHLLQLRLQPPDHIDRGNAGALLERLQRDLDAAAIHGRVHAIGADERSEILNRRILADDLDQFLLQLGHGGKRDRLGRLRNAEDGAGILHRERILWGR